jgi:hypothetical protein
MGGLWWRKVEFGRSYFYFTAFGRAGCARNSDLPIAKFPPCINTSIFSESLFKAFEFTFPHMDNGVFLLKKGS